jgi:CheY-like chemotaxis protein
VVDDQCDAAQSIATLLRMSGNDVQTAHDGPSALQTAAVLRPDVVLLDIGLPGMDGYEVARRMRASPALNGTILIALTGWGQDEDRRRSQESGIDYHLVKPVDLTALEQLLSSLASDAGAESAALEM